MATEIVYNESVDLGELKSPSYIIHMKKVGDIMDDGVKVGETKPARRTITPLDDVSSESSEVQALATQYHTADVKTAFQALSA